MKIDNYEKFNDEQEALKMLEEEGVIRKGAKKMPQLLYKGIYAEKTVPLQVIGYTEKAFSSAFFVIDFGKGAYCVSAGYLKSMQDKNYEKYEDGKKYIPIGPLHNGNFSPDMLAD